MNFPLAAAASASLAALKIEAISLSDRSTGPVAKITREFAFGIHRKIEISYRLANLDETIADENERDQARDLGEEEFAHPIELPGSLSRNFHPDERAQVDALLARAKEFGFTAYVGVTEVVEGDAPLAA